MQTVYSRSLEEKARRDTWDLLGLFANLKKRANGCRFTAAERFIFHESLVEADRRLDELMRHVTRWDAPILEVTNKVQQVTKLLSMVERFVDIAVKEVKHAG